MSSYEQFTIGFDNIGITDRNVATIISQALTASGIPHKVLIGQGRAIDGMPLHTILFEKQ